MEAEGIFVLSNTDFLDIFFSFTLSFKVFVNLGWLLTSVNFINRECSSRGQTLFCSTFVLNFNEYELILGL